MRNMYYVDENIKNCYRVFPEQGRYLYHRYDMNENPEGLPRKFVEEVLKEITPEFLAIYPEADVFLKKYANYIGVDYKQVLTTNGSDMAIRYLLETFCEKGKKVVAISPSFEMYAVNCSILGLQYAPVYCEKDMSINIDRIISAIDIDTDIVVLLNPNNPIGKAYTEEEIEQVVNKAQQMGAIVIIDEAYHYFYDKTFVKKALEYNNVVVLRTFSKLFSLAACRLGVIISNDEIINYVKKARPTFEVNAIALKFGERILDNPNMIEELIRREKDGKKYVIDILKLNGYEVIDGLGNYIFIKTKIEPNKLSEMLKKEKKILIKTYGNDWLRDYIRVSIGSIDAMKYFVEAFLDVEKDS